MNERLIDAEITVRSPAKELTRLIGEEPKSKGWQKGNKTRPGEEMAAGPGGAIAVTIAHPKFLNE